MNSDSEEAFLGTWATEFDEENGTKVRIIWTFESLSEWPHRTVWNEIHKDDSPVRHRKGEWQVLNSSTLRVVLDSENLTVTNHYDGDPEELSEAIGETIGTILGDILSALTDDEYTIDYIRDGDVLRMKWYNDEYHTYIPMG